MATLIGTGRSRVSDPVWLPYTMPVKTSTSIIRTKKFVKFVLQIFGMAAAAVALTAIYHIALTHPFFNVKKIEARGIKRLSRNEIESLIGNTLTGNIFTCDTKRAAHDLKKNPWVKSVLIRRSIPATILLEIEEREPVAVAESDERKILMDSEGIFLQEVKNAEGYLKVVGVLGEMIPGRKLENMGLEDAFRIYEIFGRDTLFHDQIVSVDLKNPDRIKARTADDIQITFGSNRDKREEKFLEYLTARKILSDMGESFREMDLSFKNQVVVRGDEPRELNLTH